MNVILQPVHLLLYMSLVSTASDLVSRNPIYVLVAIGFLIPAEKFIKRMFGLDKASSTSDFGSFAKNALAYEGLKKLGSAVSGGAGKAAKAIKGASSDGQDVESPKFNKIRRAELGSFAANTVDSGNNVNSNDNNDYGSKELSEDERKQLELDRIRDEKEKIGQELDQYENDGGDIYSSTDPEIQAKQLRYQELYEQEKLAQEKQEQERLAREQAQQKQEEQKNNINQNNTPQVRAGYKRRIAGRVGKSIGKGALKGAKIAAKGALRTGLAVGGGVIGVASAIGTGDASNVAKYALSGAYAGNSIGKGAINLTENLVGKGSRAVIGAKDKLLDTINEEKYGYSEARDKRIERGNVKARKEFIKDKEQIKKYTDIAGKIGYSGDIKNLMNAAADYKEAGVEDEMIENALKAEQKRDKTIGGDNHNKMVDVASFATKNGYKKSDILSAKSRSDMEDVVQATIAEKDRYEVMKNIADLYGQGDFYSKKSRFKNSPTKKG